MSNRITIKNGQYEEDSGNCSHNHRRQYAGINLLDAVNLVLKYKKIILAVIFLVMAAATVKVILTPNVYTAQATILPSGKIDRLAQIKQLTGLGTITTGDENSSELFPVVLRSRLILDAVLDRIYQFEHDGHEKSLTLVEYFGETNSDILCSCLANITGVRKNKSGVIEIDVSTIYPDLSRLIAREYITQLEDYNRNKRRSLARENEKYLADQMKITEQELNRSENNLEKFQMVNSDWAMTTDPTTLKELGRLKREVETKSKALLFLMQEYEIARMEVHKDIPIVRILDEPSLPALKSGPHRKVIVFLSGLASFLGTIFIILVVEAMNKKRKGPDRQSYELMRKNFASAFPRTDRVINRLAQITRQKINA